MEQASLGSGRPNLIMQFDNEKGYEFRVQLEVPMSDVEAAKRLGELLTKRDVASLSEAKEIALKYVRRGATAKFREIVSEAFDENIKVSAPAQSETKRR